MEQTPAAADSSGAPSAPPDAASAKAAGDAGTPATQGSSDLLLNAQKAMPGQAVEKRSTDRFLVRLQALLLTEDKAGVEKKTQGHTVDIGYAGVSFLSKYDIPPPQSGIIYILARRADGEHPAVIVEAKCRIVASVLSARQGGFRLSIAFTKVLNDGEQVLKNLLKDKRPMSDPLL